MNFETVFIIVVPLIYFSIVVYIFKRMWAESWFQLAIHSFYSPRELWFKLISRNLGAPQAPFQISPKAHKQPQIIFHSDFRL